MDMDLREWKETPPVGAIVYTMVDHDWPDDVNDLRESAAAIVAKIGSGGKLEFGYVYLVGMVLDGFKPDWANSERPVSLWHRIEKHDRLFRTQEDAWRASFERDRKHRKDEIEAINMAERAIGLGDKPMTLPEIVEQ